MNRLLAALDVDARQWRMMVRVFIRSDFAAFGNPFRAQQAARVAKMSPWVMLIGSGFAYAMFGFIAAILTVAIGDRLVGGTIVSSMTAFVVALNMLTTHAATMVSPDDHLILGPRPVSSRTYFAARVTAILAHVGVLAAMVGWPIVGIGLFWLGVLSAGALAAIVVGTALTIAIGIVAIYGAILRLVGPDRLSRVTSFAQLATNFAMYGAAPLVTRAMGPEIAAGGQLSRHSWALLYPGFWFGSYLSIATGSASPREVGLAAGSIALAALFVSIAGGRVSLDYAERLSAIAAMSAREPSKKRRPRLPRLVFRRDEGRAIALLVRAQFKYDNQFRMAALAFVPMTLYYVVVGMGRGVADPFLPHQGFDSGWMVLLGLTIMPMTLREQTTSSAAYMASWIFAVSPAVRSRLVLAARDVITAFIFVPYTLLIGTILVWKFGNVIHAVVHVSFLALLSQLAYQSCVCIEPGLPFSEPQNRFSGKVLVLVLAAMAMVGIGYAVLVNLVYTAPARMIAAAVILIGGIGFVSQLTKWRVNRQIDDASFLL